jgi:hypothetical protein
MSRLAVSPGTGKLLAIIGPASSGSYDVPIALSRATDVQSTFGQGPLVEAACYAAANYSATVVCMRTHATTAGACGAVTTTRATMVSPLSASTSVVTIDGGAVPYGDYEFGMIVTKVVLAAGTSALQGTLGTDHIYVQWTVDNFRTLSPVTKLPDTSTFTIDAAATSSGFDSGIQFNCAAGTLSVGDKFTGTATAPIVTTADLTASLVALGASSLSWEMVLLASAITDATPSTGVCAAMDTFIAGLMARGLFRCWIGATTMPTVTAEVAQTDAAYQASTAVTRFSTYSSATPVLMCARGALTASKNPSWPAQYILPQSYGIAPWAKSRLEEESIADSTLGALPGIALTDGNGNPLGRCGDEVLNPSLDDLRFCVLRTWSDVQGSYVNLPTLMSQSGSDFTILQRLRVWNLFASTVWAFYRKQLQKGAPYDAATGFMLKSFADRIDDLANRLIQSTLVAKNKCTDARVAVSRTDDLRVTNPTVTVEGGVQPLAYATFIALRLGFLLPG